MKDWSPEWLYKHHLLPELMRHTLLGRKYDLDEITKTITDYIDKCEGKGWMDIAQKLSRVFAWEYKDYHP
ncbi:Imm8 family immunity protein [Pantoea wallisii]|uniref:Imm8 family immunity protein n=1 Tax=Pantoea wallisii TaxID=1076551 RepID=UPI001FC900F8|nr:Imm8 family immunity protein [Pantoea wallisii]